MGGTWGQWGGGGRLPRGKLRTPGHPSKAVKAGGGGGALDAGSGSSRGDPRNWRYMVLAGSWCGVRRGAASSRPRQSLVPGSGRLGATVWPLRFILQKYIVYDARSARLRGSGSGVRATGVLAGPGSLRGRQGVSPSRGAGGDWQCRDPSDLGSDSCPPPTHTTEHSMPHVALSGFGIGGACVGGQVRKGVTRRAGVQTWL